MKSSQKVALFLILAVGIAGVFAFLLHDGTFVVLQPRGLVGEKERMLMIEALLLMLIVVVPVFALTFFIAWRYRSTNTTAAYLPDWEHARMDELIWWVIPFEIVLVLAAFTWTSTHDLDPYRQLDASPPLVVQVVALDWRWLFIYPSEGIASVNLVEIPIATPVEFQVTSDAPMNSFWIPRLGGQIYAMTGMITRLHLIADAPGDYAGASANYSGEGFAHMKFTARAVPQQEYDAWVQNAHASSSLVLNTDTYADLTKPRGAGAPIVYGTVEQNLFDAIVMKFMSPVPKINTVPMQMSGM